VIKPDRMANTVCKWLDNVSEPDAIAHYLKPETVREIVFMSSLEEAQGEAKLDAEWAADGETVQQCKAICSIFDKDGDGRLLKVEFQAFLQATLGEELQGLYDHLNQEAGKGVEAKQLYAVVYRQVFVGRRQGDAAAQISQDYATLFTPASKL